MANLDVVNWEKKKVGQIDLAPEVFEAPVRKDILHSIVRWQLAKRRAGTHQAKTRGMVSGGGAKPFRQKGTGNARQGSSRSPLNESGGVIFGPKPRDYNYNVPKKIRLAGLKSALSYLVKEGRLHIIEDMTSEGKTKDVAAKLKSFGVNKAILVDSARDDLFERATQNLKTVRYYTPDGVNVYDLLKYDTAILTQDAAKKLEARCGAGN